MQAAAGLRIMGDWKKEVGLALRDALTVSVEICGRVGAEACKHAIILMAQSARAITESANVNRRVETNVAGAKYVEVWKQGASKPARMYKFQFETDDPKWKRIGTWENAKRIGNRGLAKRSWMWGLAALGKSAAAGNPMHGLSRTFELRGENVIGYIMQNKLAYVQKAMPTDWESQVERSVGNKIMAQARLRLQKEWRASMNRGVHHWSALHKGPSVSSLVLRSAAL